MSISNHYSNALNSGYYKLNQGASSAGATAATTSSSAASSASASATSAFLLSLSPEAQDYLNSVGISNSTPTVFNANNASDFRLNDGQQQTLTAILQKYKGQPFTQETFNAIQNDLQSAGLSPDQLAQQAEIKAFNPTSALLDAISGKETTDASGQLASSGMNYDTAKTNYIQHITDTFKTLAAPTTTAA